MTNLWQDLKLSWRLLIRKRAFTAMAILTLALGTGAGTAIFSVYSGILLRPLPYQDAESIAVVWQSDLKTGDREGKVSAANFFDWQKQNQVFEHLAAAESYGFDVTEGGEPERLRAWLVTAGFFRILGTPALHGRTFLEEEEAGDKNVVVLDFGVWQRRFDSDLDLVGQKIVLSGTPYRVIGVMPPEFGFPAAADVWIPRRFTELELRSRNRTYLNVVARLKPGITLEEARSEMEVVAGRLATEYPETNGGKGVHLVALPDQFLGHVRPALGALLGAVGFVLLLSCANVGNLLLLRGFYRRRELASRAALGATRFRLVRQLFTENLLTAVLGGICGLGLTYLGIRTIRALSPANLPRIDEIAIDGRVLGFAFLVSLLSALFFGMVVLVQLSRTEIQDSLTQGGRAATSGFAGRRLRNSIVVSEIALALVLLIGTGLLLRSFSRLLDVDPGFGTRNGAVLEVHVWSKYQSDEDRANFFARSLERITALPGVKAAGAVSSLPFLESRIDKNTTFSIVGRASPTAADQPTGFQTTVTPGYFTAMQIPLVKGRFFNPFDNADSMPVALVNETMAQRYWPGQDPIGEGVVLQSMGPPRIHEIVGIVGDVLYAGLDRAPRPELFIPHLQSPTGSMTYIVQPAGAVPVLQSVKQEIWSINKDLAFSTTTTMPQLLAASFAERRLSLLIFASFAVIALVLAALGVYGLVSFSTGQRTQEIGLRMVFGAKGGDVLKLLLGETLPLILAGVGLGAGASFVLTRWIGSLLFGVTATDPFTFAGMSVLLTGVALVASYLPARRATEIEPMQALRCA
jgi:putative ABC transport system permease protein